MDDGAVISSSDGDRRAVGMPGPGGAAPGAAEPGVAEPDAAASGVAESGAAEPDAAAPDGTVLTTARLRLSPVAAHELEELFALHADPRAFAEDATAPLTEKEQMRWVLAQWRESWDRHGVGYLSLRARRPAAPPGPPPARRSALPYDNALRGKTLRIFLRHTPAVPLFLSLGAKTAAFSVVPGAELL